MVMWVIREIQILGSQIFIIRGFEKNYFLKHELLEPLRYRIFLAQIFAPYL